MIIGKVRNKLKNCIKNYKKRYEKSLVRVYKAIPTMKMGNNYGGFAVSAAFVLSNANNNIHTMGGGVIYSFGIGADLSFSQSILDACNCEVYAFDPTPKAISYVLNHPLYHNPRFHFYPIGLGSKDEIADFYLPKIDVHTPDHVEISGSTRWRDELDSVSIKVKIKCLSSIMKELGHTKIDVLKLDIEGSEFSAMDNILQTRIDFNELCIEMHNRFFTDGSAKLKCLLKSLKRRGYVVCYESDDDFLFCKRKDI